MNQKTQTRIEAIDVLRGLALALMLLVNNPGSWSAVYAPFLHANWHGLTPTDLLSQLVNNRTQFKDGYMPASKA